MSGPQECGIFGSDGCAPWVTLSPPPAADLIESLSEDRARLLEEKKRLEEEVSRLRGGAFVPSPGMAAAPELYGACAPEPPVEALDTLGEGRPDSAMETSTMSVQ